MKEEVIPKMSHIQRELYAPHTQSQSPHLSRSSSVLSLAPSCASSSSVTVNDVRALTTDYQRMLEQATQEIKKLTRQKKNLEKEQDKLLTVNIELATEAKRLVQAVKESQIDKKGLLSANEEFVQEVKRLYREEENWEKEISKLKEENKKLSDDCAEEIQKVEDQWENEEKDLILKQESLLESIRILTLDNERLIEAKETARLDISQSTRELKELHEENRIKLEATIDCLKSEIENERVMKDEVEKHMEELVDELEKVEQEIDVLKDNQTQNNNNLQQKYSKMIEGLVGKSEKLAAENFEYAVDNEQLDKKLKVSNESRKSLDKELTQLRVENQWLVSNKKKNSGSYEKAEDMARELQDLKLELRNEKEKVKNLVDWKSQLAEKNKILKDENNRLVKKTEDLEYMMNSEVSDINEMLKTINNLQVK